MSSERPASRSGLGDATPTPRAARSGAASLIASLALHVALLGLGAWLLASSLTGSPSSEADPPPNEVEVTLAPSGVDLPAMSGSGLRGAADPTAEPRDEPVAGGGGEREPRPDALHAARGATEP
jgi:hypothetical protein